MNVRIFFLFICGLINRTSSLHNPFSIESQEHYYKSKYSELKKMTVVSLNTVDNSNISVNIGRKIVERFILSESNGNLRVKIYPSVNSPQIIEVKKNITLKALCEFSYPITIVGGNGKYQCSIGYKDKSEQHHSIGSCKLTIQYKLSYCLIIGSVDMEHLSNTVQVLLTTDVYHCNSHCIRHDDLNWKSIANSSLPFPIVSWNHLMWMMTFSKKAFNIGVLIGIPKNPINKSAVFELPVKLQRHENNDKIKLIQLQVLYNKQIALDDVRALSCFKTSDPRIYEESETQITEIEIRRDDTGQCALIDRDVLFILQMSTKENAKQLIIQITLDYIGYENDQSINLTNQSQNTVINLPIFQGTTTIVPVVNNPIILPNFTRQNVPYQIQVSDLKIYYLYNDILYADVSTKVQCRPFYSQRLRCPSAMQKLAPVYSPVESTDSMQWSLELMVDGLLFVVTMEPLLRPDDQWMVMFPDSVLNLISGWTAIRRSKDTSLISDVKCVPMYQVAPIHIYKTLLVQDKINNLTKEIIVDLSDAVDHQNIRLSNHLADVYKTNQSLVIRGLSYGNLFVELLSNDGKVLLKSSMTVYNEPVSVVDLDVSCINDIQVSKNVQLSSSSLFIGDLQFRYENLNNSRDCFLMIELVFSDKSHTNILSFHKDLYNLRFVTNTKIVDVSDVDDMWYNWEKFNKETTFHVELLESNFCSSPRTIFIKQVHLGSKINKDIQSTVGLVTSATTSNGSSSVTLSLSTTITKIGKKPDIISTKSLRIITFVLISVVSVALIVIIVNILIRYYRGKRSPECHPGWRKSIIKGDVINMVTNEKDYPPLLPPPGPQVQLSDSTSVTISSPHSFWCLDPTKPKRPAVRNPFVRQSSLPIKGRSSCTYNEIAPCPPLRWADKMMPCENTYDSEDGLQQSGGVSCSPMTWSVTHMDVEESSGVGSLNTNIDDIIKDPYGSRERFHKLSELQGPQAGTKEHIYDMV